MGTARFAAGSGRAGAPAEGRGCDRGGHRFVPAGDSQETVTVMTFPFRCFHGVPAQCGPGVG
jgi:hypothetical protein